MSARGKPDSNSQDKTPTELLEALSLQVDVLNASTARLEGLLSIMAQPLLLSALSKLFKDGKQIQAYEFSDGFRSTRQIGRLINVDQKTVSTWWRTWERDFNIVEKVGKRGQFRARFTISQLFLAYYSQPPQPTTKPA